MNVCIATSNYIPDIGGIVTFNRNLCSLLNRFDHRTIILYIGYNAKGTDEDEIIHEGRLVRVILKKTYLKYRNEWSAYFRPHGLDAPNWIAMGLAMKEWLLSNSRAYYIDIIEATDYGGIGIFLCHADLPPVVLTGHGSLLQYSRYNYTIKDDHYKAIKRLEELSFLHADAIIAHSPLDQSDLQNLFQRKVELAPIPWSNDPSVTNKAVLKDKFLTIGGLETIKGIYDMVEAMELMKKKSVSIEVTWIGRDTWLAPHHQKMSLFLQKKYPGIWQKNFKWVNEYSFKKTQEEIATASLIIIPSFFETFNYIALEAASYKKPILISDKAGASYLFTHARDAWIIPANNPKKLAEAILELKDDPALCQRLGNNAADMVATAFTAKKIVEKRIAIYTRVIQKRAHFPQSPELHLEFLKRYKTTRRKYFYQFRATLKKIIGRLSIT